MILPRPPPGGGNAQARPGTGSRQPVGCRPQLASQPSLLQLASWLYSSASRGGRFHAVWTSWVRRLLRAVLPFAGRSVGRVLRQGAGSQVVVHSRGRAAHVGSEKRSRKNMYNHGVVNVQSSITGRISLN